MAVGRQSIDNELVNSDGQSRPGEMSTPGRRAARAAASLHIL